MTERYSFIHVFIHSFTGSFIHAFLAFVLGARQMSLPPRPTEIDEVLVLRHR